MSDAAASPDRRAAPRRRPVAKTAAVILAVLLLLGLAAVLLRGLIARQALEAWLRGMGVESDVSITDVGIGGAKGRMVLGDATRPDVSVGGVELDYELVAPWFGRPAGVRVRAVRLRDVVVRARLEDGRLSFGRLDKLIEQLSARPKGEPTPLPDIDLQRGALLLATDAGALRVDGSGLVRQGALQRFDGVLAPTRLTHAGLAAQVTGGRVAIRRANGEIEATGDLKLASARADDLAATGLVIDLTAKGPITEKGFVGAARLEAVAATLESGGQRLERARVLAEAPSLSITPVAGGARTSGAASIRLSSAGAAGDAVKASDLHATVTVDRHVGVWTGNRRFDAAYVLDAGAGSLVAQDVRLDALRWQGVGTLSGDATHTEITGHGAGSAGGSLDAVAARRWAASLPLIAQEPAYREAFLSAAKGFRVTAPAASLSWRDGRARIGLKRAATLRAGGGAHLTLSPHGASPVYVAGGTGAFDVALEGGGMPTLSAAVAEWRSDDDGLQARGRAHGAFDFAPLEGVVADASGTLRMAGQTVSFTADRCLTLSARRVELDANDLTQVKGEACPGGAPLFTASGDAWRARAAFRATEFAAPSAEARVRGAAGRFDLRATSGEVRLTTAEVVDTAQAPRFSTLRLSGTAAQNRQVWTVRAQAGLPDAAGLVEVEGRHDLARGVGEARFDTGALVFAEDGFQPTDVTPLAQIAGRVAGQARFAGQAAWSGQTIRSGGLLSLQGLAFDSPLGRVQGATGEIALTSLAPLITAPDQQVQAESVTFFTPLTDIRARFGLDAETLRLAGLTAKAAGGTLSLEPMQIRLADGVTQGVLVLDDVDLNQVVAATNLSEKIRLDAAVDGRLPFSVGAEGLRIENGHLASVRPGRVYIARDLLGGVSTDSAPGAPPPQTVNAIQDFAYQAIENLAFDTLDAEVASRDDGRLGLMFHVKGKHDPKIAERARLTILDVLRGRAFERRIPLPQGTPIDLTLDSSLNFDELIRAYADAWRQKVEETP